MTINLPEWFLQALSVVLFIHAVATLIENYYEGKYKKMKSAMMGMEMAVRLGELNPEKINEDLKRMMESVGERIK